MSFAAARVHHRALRLPFPAALHRLHQVAPRDDADEIPGLVHDGRSLTARERGIAGRDAARELGHRQAGRDRRHVAVHDVLDTVDLERIHAVLAHDVMAAARDLLGQDRALQQQHRDAVRRDRADEQRGKHVQVVRQLEHEDDRGQRRAHRPAHHRRHADHAPRGPRRPPGGSGALEARRARRPS